MRAPIKRLDTWLGLVQQPEATDLRIHVELQATIEASAPEATRTIERCVRIAEHRPVAQLEMLEHACADGAVIQHGLLDRRRRTAYQMPRMSARDPASQLIGGPLRVDDEAHPLRKPEQ